MNMTSEDKVGSAPKSGRETFTLMAIACLLISNSHLEGLYPRSWMAADGLLGNSIFFLLAGLGVTMSQSRRPYGLIRFYSRRILRIYPSLIFVVLVGWALGLTPRVNDASEVIQELTWPTGYGFVMLVMLLYPAGWAMARASERVGAWIATGCLLAWLGTVTLAARGIPPGETVLLGHLPKYMWHAFYALVFISGGYFGLCKSKVKIAVMPWLITVGVAGILYVVLKFAYYKTGGFESVSVAVVAGGLQGLVLLMATGLLNLIPTMNATLGAIGLERPLAWLGRSSLQVYLSHMWFARPLSHWDMAWPVKVSVFFLLALTTSVLIRWLIDYVVKYLTGKSHDKKRQQLNTIS